VVSVTADQYVNKGPGRPVFTAELRLKMLGALDVVDYVFISDSPTATEAIQKVKPNFFVKGPDYFDMTADVTGNIEREVQAVEKFGGKVVFTASPTMSSSELINAPGLAHSAELNAWMKGFNERFSYDDFSHHIGSVAGLRVLIVGEMIVDDYVFCEPLGKTSKEPVLAFLQGSSESQTGGSLAIAKHCVGLGAQSVLLTRVGRDAAGKSVVAEIESVEGLDGVLQQSDHHRTIVKTRYLDDHTGTKVFETYAMTDEPINDKEDIEFAGLLRRHMSEADVVLVADYGHGLMTPRVIDVLAEAPGVVAVNTQSNAGNRGYNSVSRYPRLDLVSLNGGEIGLELRRKHSSVEALLPELGEQTSARWIVVTEGARGLAIWREGGFVERMPAFTNTVRDRVGAGDALFVAVSLLFATSAPVEVVGLCGNLAGAAMVSDLGNRYTLKASDLLKHSQALLK
jgi:bifunctional ADP-heptose synthase (sugar kinase/adenylyltransferase)